MTHEIGEFFHHPKRNEINDGTYGSIGKIEVGGIDQLLRCFRGERSRNSGQSQEAAPTYGRGFLVTPSKPVQRKSAEYNPVTTPEGDAV